MTHVTEVSGIWRRYPLVEVTVSHGFYCILYISEAISYSESVGAVFVETSAKTGVNVNVLFHEISKLRFFHHKMKSLQTERLIYENKKVYMVITVKI